jgi:hypothetical protein
MVDGLIMGCRQCDELRNQVSEMQRAEKPKPDEANMSATRKEIYYRDELNIAKEQVHTITALSSLAHTSAPHWSSSMIHQLIRQSITMTRKHN